MNLSKQVNIFVKEKPALALLAIYKSHSDIYPSKVSKRIDSTYAHTVNIITEMEESGILSSDKKGRKRLLTLTDTGEAYSKALIEMMNIGGEGVQFPGPGDNLDFLNSTGEDSENDESGEGLARTL